jgi:hypothetical protein
VRAPPCRTFQGCDRFPPGTVTLLFSGIENSTQLPRELGR